MACRRRNFPFKKQGPNWPVPGHSQITKLEETKSDTHQSRFKVCQCQWRLIQPGQGHPSHHPRQCASAHLLNQSVRPMCCGGCEQEKGHKALGQEAALSHVAQMAAFMGLGVWWLLEPSHYGPAQVWPESFPRQQQCSMLHQAQWVLLHKADETCMHTYTHSLLYHIVSVF